jgi:hypothetical protein
LRIVVTVAALLCAPVPVLAQSECSQPQVPPLVDGARAKPDQLRAAMAAARKFIAESDVYQSCLAAELDAAKTQAGADGRRLDGTLENQMRLKLTAIQKSKDKVGAEINAAVDIYKKRHTK